MHLPCSKLRPLILRARGQGCVMSSVVLRFLALMIVAAAVLQSPVTQASSARRRSLQSLRLEDVNCGCGRNMTQKCQRKVSCVANFSKRRPRRVSVNLLYRFAAKKSKNGGRRKRRGGQKYFRLKASARRKRSIKGYQGPSPGTQHPEITSCDEWSPSIKTECAGDGKLLVEFGPENPLAKTIEVGLHEGISPRQMDTKYTQGNTSCTFENLQSGNYSVTLRPRSPNCHGVLPFRSEIIHVNGEHLPPLCSDWTPNAKIREIGVDHSRIEVSYDVPNNLQANQIEVALEEDNKMVAHKIVDKREQNCTFDIAPKKDKTYLAMVRPRGCKDCADFTLHGDPCELNFHTSRAIRIRIDPIDPTGRNFTSEPTTTLTMTKPPFIQPHTLPVMLVCSVLIVVVAGLVVVWICKRCRKKRHGSENGSEAIPLDAPHWTQEDSEPGADRHHDTIVKVLRTSELETIDETAGDFVARYEFDNRTEQKRFLLQPESNKIVLLAHIREADNGLQDIMDRFADVMQSLSSCRITLKLDVKCRKDNQKDVKGWAEGILKGCTHVVVVLSESLVTVCQSYQRSLAQAANSTSAYTDIAPLVMRQLSGGICSGLAVFVHFGMPNAEQQFESLLGLFDDLPPPYTERVAPGPPPNQGSHGNKPQLLSLRGAEGLKEFLRILSQD